MKCENAIGENVFQKLNNVLGNRKMSLGTKNICSELLCNEKYNLYLRSERDNRNFK